MPFAGLAYGGYMAWQDYRPEAEASAPKPSNPTTVELATATTQRMAQTVEAVTKGLGSEFELQGLTSSADALFHLREEQVDALVVGPSLADGSGTELLAQAADISPLTCRIVMSNDTSASFLLAAINEAQEGDRRCTGGPWTLARSPHLTSSRAAQGRTAHGQERAEPDSTGKLARASGR